MTDDDRWRAWKEVTFGSDFMIWHDGLYTGAVTALEGSAREEALGMLRLGLSLQDAHAGAALAAMGDDASIENVRAELAKAGGSDRVRLALALHALAPDPALASQLVVLLEHDPLRTVRMDAAMGLRHFAGHEDEQALLGSVERDPEYLVRYQAATSLLVRWKITPPDVVAHPDIFERLCGAPFNTPDGPADFERFREARALLERLIAPVETSDTTAR